MQIKPIMAATGVLACVLLAWPPLAMVAPNAFGAAVNDDVQIAADDKIFILQATGDDDGSEVADDDDGSGDAIEVEVEEVANDEDAEVAEEDAATETEVEVNAPIDQVQEVTIQQPQLTQIPKPAVPVSNRSKRPGTNRHKDARACLNAGDNLAIIRCAEKYRY